MKFQWIWVAAFLSKFRLRETSTPCYAKNNSENVSNAGMDMRENITESAVIRLRIGEFIWTQKILDALMDPNKSMYEKMQIYERVYLPNNVRGYNVFSGGLMDDWISD